MNIETIFQFVIENVVTYESKTMILVLQSRDRPAFLKKSSSNSIKLHSVNVGIGVLLM